MEQGQLSWIANFLWGIADDVLRDLYVRGKYRDVILPMTVLRRLDVVLESTTQAVLDMKTSLDKAAIVHQDQALRQAAGQAFYNTSKFTLRDLKNRASQQQLKADFEAYLDGFSPNVQDILDNFEFRNQIPRLSKADALGTLIEKFLLPEINLSPNPVLNGDRSVKHPGLDNHGIGTVFEELIRRFNEENNEEGEHWTPRDAVKLMARLIFLPVADRIESGTYLLYDGACGTGGMLTVAEETLQRLAQDHGKQVATHLYGQEINAETYAICKADLLLKGEGDAADNIIGGPEHSTLANDAFLSREFDFMLSNPPYGKSWKGDLERMGGKQGIKDPRFVIEHAGDPEYSLVTRSSDGQMLFLANMLSKMKQDTRLGSRIAEVHNGSSLFTGDAGQGESNIRRRIIENDWLEAIVALPLNMFYNTGIATYIWVLSNRKPDHRSGRVQLIDATQWFKPLRKNLGKKNCELSDEDIQRVCDTFLAFEETEHSKIFPNAAFGYWKVTIERPLRLKGIDPDRTYAAKEIKDLKETAERAEDAPPVIKKIHKKDTAPDPLRGLFAATIDGKPAVVEYEPDPDLRDTEHVPLLEQGGLEAFLRREVLPHAADAWHVPERQDRLRGQLHPLLLQAAAAARPGGDPRRHPGAGEGDRGFAERDHRGRFQLSTMPSFAEGQIEALARLLGECGSGTDITRVLRDRGLVDGSGESTKWRRLYWVFLDSQRKHGCANQVIDFIQSFLIPARFVGRSEEFEARSRELNTILAFSGLEYGADGRFRRCEAARTLDEAEKRVRTIRSKFQGRRIRPEVLKYCRTELLQDNYFHAVFEATKGLAQRIRDASGVDADGAALVDRVFSSERPVLAINTLRTETEKSEHKGFAALLKGCFAAVRNPLAHEPKILWEGEDDAADYLSLISLLHRKLDDCVSTAGKGTR